MQPKIYTTDEHHIRNHHIDSNALHVLDTLHEAGFIAYLVGGGVRDLLMHKRPKDFDISTSARPEQVKRLFPSCILIGKRFRLAHIRFGKHIIEVSTFRSGDTGEEEFILRDNIWGTPEEDVLRRDFTINGLFYDPKNHEIIDFVGGFEDLQKHLLRVIGSAEMRFKQDPVRMIRLLKFRARFGFHIDPEALEVFPRCRAHIKKSSPARVLEEILRMLESGAAEPFFRLLVESKMSHLLFPQLDRHFHTELGEKIYSYLRAADSMNAARLLPRSLLASCLLYPIFEKELEERFFSQEKRPHINEVMELSNDLIHLLVFEAFSHFPKKIRLAMHHILSMQYRLSPPLSESLHRKSRLHMAKHKEFSQPLLFLKLRALIDPALFKSYTRWKQLYDQAQKEREQQTHSANS